MFVDTAAWIALLNERDALHPQAVSCRRDLYLRKSLLVTTEFVLIEVADALSSPRFRNRVSRFLTGLEAESGLKIIAASSGLLREGRTLFSQREDKEWSLTDCTSFRVMEAEKISLAFTSDHHFEQAGFQKLL